MSTADREPLLAKAAARAEADPFFLGWALAAYRLAHGAGAGELAAYLGGEPSQLRRLALCRRPRSESPAFRSEVEQIARYAGVQPLRLGQLLREVEAAEALQGGSAAALLAARDAEAKRPAEGGGDDGETT